MNYYLVIQFNGDMPNVVGFESKEQAIEYNKKELNDSTIAWITYNVGFVKVRKEKENE